MGELGKVRNRKRRALLAARLRQLPWRQRAIFIAVRDEEATYRALAARFGIAVGVVEEELAAALVALADALDR